MCLTLFNPVGYSPPGSSVHGILQTGILEWVAISFSGGSSRPRDQTCISSVSCTGRRVLYQWSHLGSPKRRKGNCRQRLHGAATLKLYDFTYSWVPSICKFCLYSFRLIWLTVFGTVINTSTTETCQRLLCTRPLRHLHRWMIFYDIKASLDIIENSQKKNLNLDFLFNAVSMV